jgi:hypothetical protein
MGADVVRFLYEPANWWEVTRALVNVSWFDTLRFGGLLFTSTCKNTAFIHKFKERYKHAKGLKYI